MAKAWCSYWSRCSKSVSIHEAQYYEIQLRGESMNSKTQRLEFSAMMKWTRALLLLCGLLIPWRAGAVGNWTSVFNAPSGVQVELILLLSDGSVMAQDGATTNVEMNWYQLTPDNQGS